jgi:RND family efflux transporter MFP subunit
MQLQLVQATTRAKLARETAQREQALFDEGIIAARRVQEAQAGLAEGEAALRVAQGSLRMAGMSAGAISRVAASGKPEDGVTLTAARAGIITEINVKPGQRVEPGFALMHLAQLDQLALEIQAPAGRASEWRVGSKLKLQGRPGGATITSISPIVAAGSQTSALRAEVWRGSGLRPGEFVTVELPLAHHATAFDVPLRALAYERDKTVVFVRTAGGFEARPVIVQSSAGQMARVEGRLAAGERIAVSGVIALKGSWLGEKGGE